MKFVVDVTQLVHWAGNLTGIPRVMDELSLRFAKFPNVVFVSWVKEIGEMCEVDFLSTRTHRGNGIDYILKNAQNPREKTDENMNENSAEITEDLKNSANSAKSALKKIAKKLAAKSRFDRTKMYKNLVNSALKIEYQTYKIYAPARDDKLVIIWGEWWDQNWLDKMKNFARENVEIFPFCHDILPMVVPQFSGNSASLKDFVEQIFPLAKTVITISKSTKNDLTKWMAARELKIPPIEIFRLGEDFKGAKSAPVRDAEMLKKYGIKKNNFLIRVSTIEPRKNDFLLYYTYKLASARGIKLPKLLVIGRVGHDVEEIIKFIKFDPEINDSIKICDFVDDNELNWLYKNCKFTVLASFYEGWGMSVLESVSRGKPAVCSGASSLAEMPEKYVLHFSPASTDECLAAILKMSQPEVLVKYLRNAAQYKSHTWDDSFAQVLKVLKD